jgi:hypothetical protein
VRLVYRPFADRERVTPEEPVEEFTHAAADERTVEIINGVSRSFETTALD